MDKPSPSSSPSDTPQEHAIIASATDGNVEAQVATRFVGQWNRLVSTTNWEKGRIICQWREALMTEGAPVSEYSDEAWAQLVGGVTSQHVGRLRRVYQRFGNVSDQYEGLYWSHFQAAIDWDDAEMWLEGAIQNDWSVSQMRGKRWETLGTPRAEQQAELDANKEGAEESAPLEPTVASVHPAESNESNGIASTAKSAVATAAGPSASDASAAGDGDAPQQPVAEKPKRLRLKVNVDVLPDDLADAFEQFKLAIISQRREGWRDTTLESVLECLDALRELALAGAD